MFSADLGKQVCLLWNFYVQFEMFAWAFYGFSGTELSQKMVYMKIFAFEQSSTWLAKWIYSCVESRHEIIW